MQECRKAGLTAVKSIYVKDSHNLNTTMVDGDLLRGIITDTVERHRQTPAEVVVAEVVALRMMVEKN